MLKRIAAALFALVLGASPALAGAGTITVLDSTGATQTYKVITDGSSHFVGTFGLCDGVAAAQCVAVKAASTAAGATDPALVVAISPNNTVAVTQSGSWNLVNISGTVSLPTGAATSANQPTSAAQGSTTSGQTGNLHMGAASTAAPSYTNGQTDPISLDLNGSVRVNCTTGCSSSSSITGWAGSTIGAATIQAFGALQATIGAGLVPAVNAYIVNTLAGIAWSADGVANTTLGSPTTSLMMASNGTTVDRLQDDANKNLKVVLPSTQAVADPCMFQAKTKVPFSTTSGSTQLVALSGSTKIYVCAVHFISTSADSISFTEGTGTACATGATAVSGSTTAASGMDFPALGGMTEGGGVGTVMNTSVAGDELCLLQSGTTKIAGNLEVVQQ